MLHMKDAGFFNKMLRVIQARKSARVFQELLMLK